MNKKELMLGVGGLVVLGALVAAYFYFSKPADTGAEGALGATQQASEGVPKIVTNPAEEIPEVNPLDRANPFKYNNPLR